MAVAAADNLVRFNPRLNKHQDLLSFATRLKDNRQQWLVLWDELAMYFLPDRRDFLSKQIDGQDRRMDIYGSVAEIARRGLSSTLATMLRPAGKTWFKARTKNQALMGLESVRLWCEAVTEITYAALYDPKALFEKQAAECDADVVTFGTGVLQIGWNKAGQHLKFKTHSLKYAVPMMNEAGHIDTMFMWWKMPLRNWLQMFPEQKLPKSMQDELSNPNPKIDREFEVLHACLPNADYKRLGLGPNRLPYSSIWIGVDDKELIDESGYYGFPYATPRWDTTTGEVYGRAPAMIALRDARLANVITKSMVDASEKALNPPLMGAADLIRGNIELWAGGFTSVDMQGMGQSGEPIKPVQLGTQPQKMLELLNLIEDRIGAAFFRDILELPSARDKDITATEVNARLDQYLRQAAPVFSRLEANYNASIMNRVFDILFREGQYPEPPQELLGQEIEFEYESPIKAARDKAEAMKIGEYLQMTLPLAQANPDILDNFDFDVIARLTGQKSDVPQIIFKQLEQMLQERQARAQQQKMAQMAEMAKAIGPAAGSMMQGLAKSKDAGLIGSTTPFPMLTNEAAPDSQQIEDAAYEVLG